MIVFFPSGCPRPNDFSNPTHPSVFQSHLDAMRVVRGMREDLFNGTARPFPGALILF